MSSFRANPPWKFIPTVLRAAAIVAGKLCASTILARVAGAILVESVDYSVVARRRAGSRGTSGMEDGCA